ncbi:hypothetical protein Z043_119437 [Scleropages formosus]|uniref:Hexosyltransferase n=1 Tax=Scleropages formosus TaxID=113540 RepID=A0A0P7UKZ7_SCLFO|nr:hypothetical protein Z043_119437 [Scleropages formosus]
MARRCVLGAMALRSRRPWVSVLLGVVLGFTAASWLIVPTVLEIGAKRRKSTACAYYGHAGGLGRGHESAGGTAGGDAWRADADEAGDDDQEEQDDEDEERTAGNRSARGHGGPPPPPFPRPRNFLYVGVMTAKKYLDSRAVAAHRTWTRSIPGKVEFFSSEGSGALPLPAAVPVVSLPGYMHDHYLHKYEWFMRADDDVYIRGD